MRATTLGLSLTLIVLIGGCYSDPNDANKSLDVFLPTKEWQEISKGQSIPAGLHVRIDMQTGKKEAKLMDQEDSDQGDSDTDFKSHGTRNGLVANTEQYPFGESDRRGVINKRTKVFRAEEVKDMLRELNRNDFTDQENVPRIAAGKSPSGKEKSKFEHANEKEGNLKDKDRLRSIRDLKLSFHQDIEVMIEISKVLADNSSSVSELCHALEGLEYYVHQIDNARDLNVIGGLVLVVRLLNHTNPEVRSWAAHVIGSASQSNPPVQAQALEYNSLPLLSTLLYSSEPDLVQRRALFALSALLRGNSQEQLNFIKVHHGLRVLANQFEERSSQVQLKAVVLLTDLLNEFNESENIGHHLELSVMIYSEVLNSGWCKNIPTLIYSDQLVRVEKGLIAMELLVQTCGFTTEMQRLKDLMKWLENDTDKDMEYVNQLLEHCKILLKSIRQYNSDL